MNGCERINDEVDRLADKYSITILHAGCYICNAINDYICKTYNGGCKKIEICKTIKANEGEKMKIIKQELLDWNKMKIIKQELLDWNKQKITTEAHVLIIDYPLTDIEGIQIYDRKEYEEKEQNESCFLSVYVLNALRKLRDSDDLTTNNVANKLVIPKTAAAHYIDIFNKLEEKLLDLKPCPFCGGKARVMISTRQDGGSHYYTKSINCTDCGCGTVEKTCSGYYGQYCTDEEIAALWNRRVGY